MLSNNYHFDLLRARKANILVQFFALFTMPTDSVIALKNVLLQIEKFLIELEKNKNHLYLIKSFADIEKNLNRIGAILHLEGAEAIGRDIELLNFLYRLGLRSMGLTWNYRNFLASGVSDGDDAGGLSKLGKKVLREMEELGIILDLSHISERAFFDSFDYYRKPIMVTHSNVQGICPHPRNLSDAQLRILAQNDGIIGINQVSSFVGHNNPGVKDLVKHIKYVADFIGTKHLALGSDFDGATNIIMSGVEEYSNWENILSDAGFSSPEIDMILYKNALRIIENILGDN